MAGTYQTDVLNPEILTEAVRARFAQKNAFMGSRLTALGVAMVSGSMPQGGPNAIGTTITVPYFGTLGEFVNNPDGSSVTPSKIAQTSEDATISRDSLAFQVSRWAQGNAAVNPAVGDPYVEAANQIMEAAERAIDKRLIDIAKASGVYVKDVYSASAPVTISYDLFVDAAYEAFGDESDDIAAILTHSHGMKDMRKLKDSTGRPLLLESAQKGEFPTFAGLPVITSDRVPLDSSAMGAVTSSGTTPPSVTLSGTPKGAYKLHIDVTTGGLSDGTAKFRFSVDDGQTWSAILTIPAGGGAIALTDTATDSLVGVNGATGVTATFANGTYNADNLYTATASLKVKSMLLKPGALAFWFSQKHMELETDKDIMQHTDLAAMHLYGAAHRYRRVRGGTKPGVVHVAHNVSNF